MAITINIYYTGKDGGAKAFAEAMTQTSVVDRIRAEAGNIRYEYFFPMDDSETVLLIDSWTDQSAIDEHHKSPMMQEIIRLREKYDLHMRVERYVSVEGSARTANLSETNPKEDKHHEKKTRSIFFCVRCDC
jgi:quinol monooxygenase YgiN